MQSLSYLTKECRKTLRTPEVFSGSFAWSGLEDDLRQLLLAIHVAACERPVVVICSDDRQLKNMQALFSLENKLQPTVFPAAEIIPFEVYAQSEEIAHRRVSLLAALAAGYMPRVVLTTMTALANGLMPPELWRKEHMIIKTGDVIDVDKFLTHLIEIGYHYETVVTHVGELSVRGGIIDIFSPLDTQPVRIELFDDEIDSLRYFAVEDQRSVISTDEVEIMPARELFYLDNEADVFADRLCEIKKKYLTKVPEKNRKHIAGALNERLDPIIQSLRHREYNPNLDLYKGYFFDRKNCLLDYYESSPLIILEEINRIEDAVTLLDTDRQSHFTELLHNGMVLPEQWGHYYSADDFSLLFKNHDLLGFSLLTRKNALWQPKQSKRFEGEALPSFFNRMDLFEQELAQWQQEGLVIRCPVSNNHMRSQFIDYLDDHKISYATSIDANHASLIVYQDDLKTGGVFWQDGFILLPVHHLFAPQKVHRRRRLERDDTVAYSSAGAIQPGDYVVHENHGIGLYLGMEHVNSSDVEKDYLLIKYAGSDKLYVPVEQFDFLQKYVGQEGKRPKLNKLSGTEWQRTKKRVAQSVADLADSLIKLYAERESEPGHAFPPDDDMQYTFEQSFPYVETEDQLQAIEDVKNDMMRPVPMDRLICGDVGYGKTEVAIRAAFKAVADGKQVAVLVPTTVLAQQHYETFKSRFEDFAVRVAVLSRFNTPKETATLEQALKDHKIDIIIGTHKLLNKRIEFSDLGLLVVDEEQRFGVSHKERIKAMKTQVDVLTLSATPIPRTLHLSLAGIRDMSIIETPPADRYPIQTYVVEMNDVLLEQAIRRELARDGQVFVIQNRIEALDGLASKIQTLVPEARILTAHGRAKERELEKVMLDFVNHEADVLVCTTIIETGLDIPNVNTLVVVHADTMGLSQLYQLRGRVGRSHRVAYAYLTYEPNKMLTSLAEKRLNTLKEYTALGSGYRIAMKDLELRGAGNLLGAEQHGHVVDVGFDMYLELLNEAVALKTGKTKEDKRRPVELDLRVNAFIPDEYIKDESVRLSIYKRIERATSENELEDIIDECIDRFGDVPESLAVLFSLMSLKLVAYKLKISSMKQRRNTLEIQFYPNDDIDFGAMMTFVQKYPTRFSLSNKRGELVLSCRLKQQVLNKKSLDSMKLLFSELLSIVSDGEKSYNRDIN